MITMTNKRVLVVDDVMVNRKLAAAIFNKLGWQPSEADGGLAALDALARPPPPALVLLDISMPDLDGEEVCRRLRADPAHAGLRLIAFTAHTEADALERFARIGFDAALAKPVSPRALMDLLKRLFPD